MYANKKSVRKVTLTLVAIVLLLTLTIGATVAYLADKTDPVKNTFTSGDVSISLNETKDGQNVMANSYLMVPGYSYTKDPVVTVAANSEKCYVFVKIEKSIDFDTFVNYTMDSNWIALTNVDGVFYQVVKKSATSVELPVIAGDKITVPYTVTKEMLHPASGSVELSMNITAYAIQYFAENDKAMDVNAAWNQVKDLQN